MAAAVAGNQGLISTVVTTIQAIAQQRNDCLEAGIKHRQARDKAAIYGRDYFFILNSIDNPASQTQLKRFKEGNFAHKLKLPGKYWQNLSNQMVINVQIREGENPSDGLEAIYSADRKKMGLSFIDCTSACEVACYHAILREWGKDKFNALLSRKSLTPLSFTRLGPVSAFSLFLKPPNSKTDKPRKGDFVDIQGIPGHNMKDLSNHAHAFVCICIDDTPNHEKFTTLGLPSSGSTLEEIRSQFVAEFNQPSLESADLYSESFAKLMDNEHRKLVASNYSLDIQDPRVDAIIQKHKTLQLTAEKVNSIYGHDSWGQIKVLYSLDEERIATIAKLSIEEGRKQMDEWMLFEGQFHL